uniref:EGF-like domain-containing protein n=1 Tax=Scophthalmus maximus TaxID=52904 RepID=A0A8D3C6G5_SCOMX
MLRPLGTCRLESAIKRKVCLRSSHCAETLTVRSQATRLKEMGLVGVRTRPVDLLQATWLCCLLAVQVHSCPGTCSKCWGPENDQCEECRAGWTLHNNTCVDIDECGTELGNCPHNSYCFNTEGSYECRDCDPACVGCMGSGPARCRKCASGYRLTGSKCLDIDECSDRVLACHGLDEICTNTDGSFRCDCAERFFRKDGVCVKKPQPSVQEKGLFDDIQDDEVEVLQQMLFGVVLCALATLAAKATPKTCCTLTELHRLSTKGTQHRCKLLDSASH